MKAPVAGVEVSAASSILPAVESAKDDIMRMLQITALEVREGKPDSGLTQVDVTLEA
jgi:hypothetical protein